MFKEIFLVTFFIYFCGQLCDGQVLQFGTCATVKTKRYFDFESVKKGEEPSKNNKMDEILVLYEDTQSVQISNFLGEWYEIERFPTWYEKYGNCAFKRLQYCGRTLEIEHIYVRNGIQFILHVNSTYIPGDEAVFAIHENNIDPVGIPLSVISTDYTNYAVVYGCRYSEEHDLKYLLAWILSRTPSLPEATLLKARLELNAIPFANVAYLQPVNHDEKECAYHWTAHIQAENITEATRVQMLSDKNIFDFL